MMDEFDHTLTEEIVCPYCGEIESDSWEYNGDDGEIECSNCEQTYAYTRVVDISYTTVPKEEQ